MSRSHAFVLVLAPTRGPLSKACAVFAAFVALAMVGIPMTSASSAATGGQGPANSSSGSNLGPPVGTIIEYKLPSTVSTPSGIAKGPDGNVWFTTEHGGTIGKITPTGAIGLFTVAPTGSSLGGIATGPDGSIWFTDYTDARVGRISAAGSGVTLFPIAGTPGLAGIVGGADGNVWFSEAQANTIGRMSTSGNGVTGFPTLTAGAWPHGLGLGPDGNVWFAEIKADKVGRITPAGSVSEWTLPTAKAEPRVIATGADGNLWFTEFAGNKVGRITPTGAITEFPVPTSSSGPVGIAQGQDGYAWFTEQSGNKIGRISMSGSITEFSLPTAAAQPDKITLGGDGNLWFTERSSNKIGTIVSGQPMSVAPANTIAPAVSGVPAQGQTLRATQGSWSGLPIPSISYQWLRCDQTGANCAAIAGANGTTYTVSGVDVGTRVGVQVSATSTSGTASASSAITAAIAGPPVPESPGIAGVPVEGQGLTAVAGVWKGFPAPELSFQWLRCDAFGGGCVSIPGATGSAYVLGAADVGGTLEVSVTGVNASGEAVGVSAPTSVVGPFVEAPVAVMPTVVGVAAEGQTLTAVPGSWGGVPVPVLSFQWLRCDVLGGVCVPIAGATGSTYVLGAADVGGTVEVSVTGTNAGGVAVAGSGVGAVVAGPPVPGVPAISGVAVEGQTLTVAPGVWGGYPTPALSYQWLRCDQAGANCTPIPGASGSRYVVAATDVEGTLRVNVTGSNASGEAVGASAQTTVVGQPPEAPVSAVPVVVGSPVEGQMLSVVPGVWGGFPVPVLSFQWLRCDALGGGCVPIAGATGNSYVPVAADVGETLEVSVTGANAGGSAVASSGVGAVVAGPPVPAVPLISGAAVEGQTLTVTPGVWGGYPAPELSYEWLRCDQAGTNCAAIPGLAGSAYVVGAADVGGTLKASVTGANASGTASATSNASATTVSATGPLTPVLDNFNRANNAGPPSGSWTHAGVLNSTAKSNILVVGNQATGASGTDTDFWSSSAFGQNSEAFVTVASLPAASGDFVALGLRAQSPATSTASAYQGFYVRGTTTPDEYKIVLRTNGTSDVALVSTTVGPRLAPGDGLLFRAIGSALELWVCHAGAWSKVLSAKSTTIVAGGYAMLTARNSVVRLDDFGAGTLP